MKVKATVLFFCLFITYTLSGQTDHLADSLQRELATAHNDADKVFALSELGRYYTVIDNQLANKYGEQAIGVAELSRDRHLIAYAWVRNGDRLLSEYSLEDNLGMALQSFSNAEKVAMESGLDELLGFAYIGLARASAGRGDHTGAINYNNLAVSIAGGLTGGAYDSLKVAAYDAIGKTYSDHNEKLLAFRNFLTALDVADLSGKKLLQRLVYKELADFYVSILEYDKALDYAIRQTVIDSTRHALYDLMEDDVKTGEIFVLKNQFPLALSFYERAIALADSARFYHFKIPVYLHITNMYLGNKEYMAGMRYLQTHEDVLQFFRSAGIDFFLDEGYGSIYTALGKYDSAGYFFAKAEPVIAQKGNPQSRSDFYLRVGNFYRMKQDYRMSVQYYLKAQDIGAQVKDMSVLQACAQNLDSLYEWMGDYKTAYRYNIAYNAYKDSIRDLTKETELLKLEVDNDARRRERLQREEEENTRQRHNIQYMGFTIGLICLFMLLVMLGFFMVSPRTIRALGFFSFIFLFEFIILLADKQIHEWTHGEPWKILCIKICLAAILLPLHHWLEHTVIHYLSTRKKVRLRRSDKVSTTPE